MRRQHVVKVRLSDSELTRLDALANLLGIVTRGATLRALVRAAEPGEPFVPGDSLMMLLSEIPDAPELEETRF